MEMNIHPPIYSRPAAVMASLSAIYTAERAFSGRRERWQSFEEAEAVMNDLHVVWRCGDGAETRKDQPMASASMVALRIRTRKVVGYFDKTNLLNGFIQIQHICISVRDKRGCWTLYRSSGGDWLEYSGRILAITWAPGSEEVDVQAPCRSSMRTKCASRPWSARCVRFCVVSR
jgi:hypothetical protein